jgi:L-amino acid N-acyltransferase YncA
MKIVVKKILDIPSAESKILYNLRLKPDSLLYDRFREIRTGEVETEAYALIAYEEEKILGWALIRRQNGGFTGCFSFKIYIRQGFRRRGIGKRILKRAVKLIKGKKARGNTVVFMHDEDSIGFYQEMKKDIKRGINLKKSYS